MTRIRRDGNPPSPFSEWVRAQPELESRLAGVCTMDIDWIWHQYKIAEDTIGKRTINHILLIEEKMNGKDLEWSQRDTMWLMHQLFEYVDKNLKNKKWKTIRGDKIQVRYWGYFKLRYEGLTLPNSEWIEWNKCRIDLPTLKEILLFQRHPRTLAPRSDRRHHCIKPLSLFETQICN